ncbi:MAG TPA: ABC transporter ATP-binding protein [Acidimicrobiales bacterium]|nr:ABC transporter ATP-binding protein [Acidimicrobiales bacterium]
MAWGGGMAGGGMVGGGLGPPGGRVGNPGNGLPFAGIPSELQAGVDKLLQDEPEYGEPTARFSYSRRGDEAEHLNLRGLLFKHWKLGVLAIILVAIVSVANQAGPKLIDIAITQGMEGHKNMHLIVVVSLLYLLAIGITALAQRYQVRTTGRLAAWVMNDLRVKVFNHLQRLALDFYTEEKAGVIMTRMTSDIENLQQLLQDGLASFAVQGLTMIVITAILFTMNVELALITILLIIPALTALSLWFRSASEAGYDRVRDGIANVLADLSETLHGVRIVTAHNRQRHNILYHRNVVGEYQDANNFTARINAVYGPGTQMLGFVGQAALLAIGGEFVARHTLSVGDLVAFFLYLNRFFAPIQLLVQQYNTYQQGQASVTKLRGLLNTEPGTPQSDTAVDLPPIRGDIFFENVTFGYDPAVPVIHDISVHIHPGETVAFVGATGAGKSTMAKLVTRFYDPTGGRVTIDGYDLKDVTIGSLRRQLGVVPQEPFLFAGTIRDNVAFAAPESSDDQVWEAIRAVGLVEVIERMPDGLDTVVHERGQSLSSGERQLIALARAFVAQPRVLVLDEATSNLDLLSETKIEAALDILLEGRSAILIAHRLTTAMKADRIIVVDDGVIAESGSHDELLQLGGRYAQMYETWMSHAEGEAA